MYSDQYRSPMYEAVLHMIRNRPEGWTYERISRETGISMHWISSVMSRRLVNPGTHQIEYLYHYLRKQFNVA